MRLRQISPRSATDLIHKVVGAIRGTLGQLLNQEARKESGPPEPGKAPAKRGALSAEVTAEAPAHPANKTKLRAADGWTRGGSLSD